MFDTLSRSWEYAKTSYALLWTHKHLIVLPLLAGIAALVVMATFALPLWQSGTIDQWAAQADAQNGNRAMMYVTMFAFYVCNYFVIVFFNTALVACAMQALAGERPTLGYGLGVAWRRFGPIFGWAVVSAVIGVLLRAIENSNKRAAQFVSALLGMAWTAMTYLVVPVIAVEGVGPVKAFKRSLAVLRQTWGTALVGNFSLGLLSFLVMLPVILIAVALIYLGVVSGSAFATAFYIAVATILLALAIAFSSAADVVFKAILFSYATGRKLPADISTRELSDAFTPRQ
ncbi:MAG: hypothetical protein GX591_17425 [Planctomycetes bacterium]|nr:hypothetical protein [Planctomycetota bacterium]